MSWYKNTINGNYLDSIISTLSNYGVQYNLTERTKVRGYGLNDDHCYCEEQETPKETLYPIRKLEFNRIDGVTIRVFEQMQRSHDYDSDDYLSIISFVGNEWKGIEPPIETYNDCEDFDFDCDCVEGVPKSLLSS